MQVSTETAGATRRRNVSLLEMFACASAAATLLASQPVMADSMSDVPQLIVLDKPVDRAVVAKAVSYRQTESGQLELLGYDFFAEFALSSAETAVSGGVAQLIAPTGEILPFKSGLAMGERLHGLKSLEQLNTRMPNGRYAIRYTRPGLVPFTAVTNVEATPATMPKGFKIRLHQQGRPVKADAVNAALPLVIEADLTVDQLAQSLIFVHVGDCYGRRLARTAPLPAEPDLAYRGSRYGVPAKVLQAGATYQVFVESGSYSLNRADGVPVFASYPLTTFLDFKTTGESRVVCPAKPYQMDLRQTDRAKAP
jgi:hypothetical protein